MLNLTRLMLPAVVCAIAVPVMCFSAAHAEQQERPSMSFLDAKTVFQIDGGYRPILALAVDGVIVHRHGEKLDALREAISSWKEKGYLTGRMFFADSDGRNVYWTGKWDGTPHEDEVERDAEGNVVKCANIRPYMLPTEGWIRYLEEMTRVSIEAGADAVLPEEPLAHVFTGYEGAFRPLWEKRYGRPWQPENASPEAHFLTAQLKNELYIELERRLGRVTAEEGRRLGRDIAFLVPVHSLYSNIASQLVAPLGTSDAIEQAHGYIGQVWTGPVNWALDHYRGNTGTFFTSAYALYDYFVAMVSGTDKRLWLLVDPVEDNPDHKWPEYEEWYRHCVVAMLMFHEVDRYEVMPWPDRIFIPGRRMGGGTPAPEPYRIVLLTVTQVLQEVPAEGRWITDPAHSGAGDPTEGIAVAMADTLMWEAEKQPRLGVAYGMSMPLVVAGVPVSTCILERSQEPGYLSRFKVIVLSYESMKPLAAEVNSSLAAWVRGGGVLVVLGEPDDLGGAELWWKQKGHASPLAHLLSELGVAEGEGRHDVGKGCVFRRPGSPRRFADGAVAQSEYLPLIDQAARRAGIEGGLSKPGGFCKRRGPFVIAHATQTAFNVPGKLVDIFDDELPVLDGAAVGVGQSGLFRDVTGVMTARGGRGEPCVLHATHRLMEQKWDGKVLRMVIRGPAETPGVVRVFCGGRSLESVSAQDHEGKPIPTDVRQDGVTLRLRFPNVPEGVTLQLHWRAPAAQKAE